MTHEHWTFASMLLLGALSVAIGLTLVVKKSAMELRLRRSAYLAQQRRDELENQAGHPEARGAGTRETAPSPASLLSPVPRANAINGADSESLLLQTWAVSRERESYLDRRTRCYISAVGGAIVVLGGVLVFQSSTSIDVAFEQLLHIVGGATIAAGLAVIIYASVPYMAARAAFRSRRLALASARVDEAITNACKEPRPLQIQQLFQLNRRQLDEYQLITRKQQRSAFLLAQIASVVAFAVLIGGVALAFSQKAPVDKYVTSGLSALGSLLSGFLAATFFQSSRDSNEQMNRYYLEPQRTGRLLAAERIVRNMPNASEQEQDRHDHRGPGLGDASLPTPGQEGQAEATADGAREPEDRRRRSRLQRVGASEVGPRPVRRRRGTR